MVLHSPVCRATLLAFVYLIEANVGFGAETAIPETALSKTAIPETGTVTSSLASFDRLMRGFMRDNKIPGGALAVAKDGRLVYARGFGYADVEHRQEVQPDSLFRIASISKPITAVAILQLVDARRITLDTRVFELLPHRAQLGADQQIDSRLRQITIEQLLQHRGGWDRDRSIDPMFQSVEIANSLGVTAPAKPDDIISFMLGWKLDFDPGDRYAYSNFGYCVLGRVIEHVSGESYEAYVQQHVLRPLGIDRMRIGRSLASQRCAEEVKYYTPNNGTGMAVVGTPIGRRVPRPYGTWYLEAMDAHGGWIGSALDLVRFGTQVQRRRSAHLISSDMYRAMLACPPGVAGHDADGKPNATHYGFGWRVRKVGNGYNLWHSGALPGTSTLLVQRHDGLCWAVLFNTTYTTDGQRPASKIDSLIHKAADAVKDWPQHDLFEAAEPKQHVEQ